VTEISAARWASATCTFDCGLWNVSKMFCVGYVAVLPCIDTWKRVDLRTKAFSVPPQKVSSSTLELSNFSCS